MGINKQNLVGMSVWKLNKQNAICWKPTNRKKMFLDQAFRGVDGRWSNDDLRRKQLGKVEDCGRFGEGL